MMENKYRSLKGSKPCITFFTLVLVVLFSFPALSWSRSRTIGMETHLQDAQGYDGKMRSGNREDFSLPKKHRSYASSNRSSFYPELAKNHRNRYKRLPPEKKNMLKKRYREWESLPEHKQQMLRHRMEKYKRLPPQERERYQHRYRQFQKLPPDERYKIREKLRNWDRLSPDEKEQIRRRFRNP